MKKVLSLLLSLVMLFSVLSGISLNAYATDKTATQAINWVVSKVGTQIDVDGAYPGECVDLIMAYYEYLGVSRPFGNGKDYASNALPSGWNRYQGAQPQKGDILVYTTGTYGHVAVYVDDNLSYHQNYNGVKTVQPVNGRYNSIRDGYWGVIRPNFANDYINLGDSFYAHIIKLDSWKHITTNDIGNVELCDKNNSYHPKQIWHFLRQSNGSYKIINEYSGLCLDAANFGTENGTNIGACTDNGGAAQRWFIYKNGDGVCIKAAYCDKVLDVNNNSNDAGTNIQLFTANYSSAQTFYISKTEYDNWVYSKPAKPDSPTVTAKVDGNSVIVSWSESKTKSVLDNRVYKIKVYLGVGTTGKLVYSNSEIYTTNVTLLFSDGPFTITVTAVNSKYYNYYTTSEPVTFCCGNKHVWDSGTITKKATYTEAGVKAYTCTACGETKTETIPKLKKKTNPLVAKGKTATVKYAKVKKKAQTVAQKNAFAVSKAQGKVTYSKASGNKKITVSKAGKITVKKGLKKGTYKVKVKVTAAGNTTYKAKTVTVTVTVKVK